ncbi:pirin family protein [Paenibacillus sp. 2TAB19]
MLRILRSNETPVVGRDPFKLRMIRPGRIFQKKGVDLAFGPLGRIDHAFLDTGTVVGMHEHRNDEIFSYMWHGTMVHEDSSNIKTANSPMKLMMMNAGSSFFHQESVPSGQVEMLQIFIRPEKKDLNPAIQFYDRPVSFANGEWNLLAGPQELNAPLTIRQRVAVYDIHAKAGREINIPSVPGMTAWVYVMDGNVTVDEAELFKGDAISDSKAALPTFRSTNDTTLVAFLVDMDAPATLSGWFSGLGEGYE